MSILKPVQCKCWPSPFPVIGRVSARPRTFVCRILFTTGRCGRRTIFGRLESADAYFTSEDAQTSPQLAVSRDQTSNVQRTSKVIIFTLRHIQHLMYVTEVEMIDQAYSKPAPGHKPTSLQNQLIIDDDAHANDHSHIDSQLPTSASSVSFTPTEADVDELLGPWQNTATSWLAHPSIQTNRLLVWSQPALSSQMRRMTT